MRCAKFRTNFGLPFSGNFSSKIYSSGFKQAYVRYYLGFTFFCTNEVIEINTTRTIYKETCCLTILTYFDNINNL